MHLTYNTINSQYAVGQLSTWIDLEGFYAFNAKELDEENGMYYYSARYYAPPTFISRDPLFEKYPFMSPYAYCANNPVKFVDPTGKEFGETFSKLTGKKIHDDGIEDNKVYVGTKSDGSDREYVGQKSDILDMTSKFRKQLKETKSFFEKKNKEFSAKESMIWGGWGKKAYDRLSFFQSQVTDGANFDLKNLKEYAYDNFRDNKGYSFFEGKLFRYDDYGNYNYGVAAKAFGLSETMALFGAGMNQTKKALTPTAIKLTPLGIMPVLGEINLMFPSNIKGFFDNPKDTHMIKKGYSR